MVNEESPANSGSWVNFNTSQEAIDVGEKTSQKTKLISPQ